MPARKPRNKKKNQHQPKQNGDNKISEDSKIDLPYRIENSSLVGRYIVASRDLRPGQLLITEEPLAIGPCDSAQPVCLGCYVPVELTLKQFRCSDCKWPLCGPKCSGLGQSNGHTSYECALFALKNTAALLNSGGCSPSVAEAVKNLYELVLIVRILLMKSHDPDKYAAIQRMEAHTEMRKMNTELWQYYETNVVERLRREWQLEQFDPLEIHNICGILDVNCFEIGQLSAKARALYPSAFLLAHDCCPNTSHTDDPRTYALTLRTSRAVYRDEAITLSYAYTLQGTLKRREFMHAGKLFWCSCHRCEDPYELGSDCSALVCAKCNSGSVRATDPLDQEGQWRCDSCEFVMSAASVVRVLDRINNDLESIDVHDIPGLENFLKRYSNVLRPNHYFILSAKHSLCQLYGRIEGYLIHDMSSEDIKRKETYCREFLTVIDKLEPGLTRLRGLIMYELHAAIMVLAQRCLQAGQISRKDFQQKIKEVTNLLKQSRDMLKMEPKGSKEYEMGIAAEEALINIGRS